MTSIITLSFISFFAARASVISEYLLLHYKSQEAEERAAKIRDFKMGILVLLFISATVLELVTEANVYLLSSLFFAFLAAVYKVLFVERRRYVVLRIYSFENSEELKKEVISNDPIEVVNLISMYSDTNFIRVIRTEGKVNKKKERDELFKLLNGGSFVNTTTFLTYNKNQNHEKIKNVSKADRCY